MWPLAATARRCEIDGPDEHPFCSCMYMRNKACTFVSTSKIVHKSEKSYGLRLLVLRTIKIFTNWI
jgi:predicted metal-binding protein